MSIRAETQTWPSIEADAMWMILEGIEGMDGCCFGVLGDGALVACMDGDIAEDGLRDGASRTMLSCRGA